MLKFTEAWTVKKIPGGDFWEVAEPFTWFIIYGLDEHIVVPGGFKTNFGSIPRIFWWLFNPTAWTAYVLHDYLYTIHYRGKRNDCDVILYEALVAEGCNKIVAGIIYISLFLFGRKAWNSYK